jgi:hypothetical protein
MIANQVQKWIRPHKIFGAVNGVPIAKRFRLVDEMEPTGVVAGHLSIRDVIAGPDNHAYLLDIGSKNLLDDDAQHRFFGSVPVYQGLEGQRALPATGSGNNGLGDLHQYALFFCWPVLF